MQLVSAGTKQAERRTNLGEILRCHLCAWCKEVIKYAIEIEGKI